jgi:methyl-accepting chemotaxis protein
MIQSKKSMPMLDQAGTTMEEIVESIKRVTGTMGEITAASQKQTSGIEKINQAITHRWIRSRLKLGKLSFYH